jgi:sugar phosphate isomerase/epimerase
MIANTNDGSSRPPRLSCYMSELALNDMRIPGQSALDAIQAAGYDGIQVGDTISPEARDACHRLGLSIAGSARVNLPAEADTLAARMADAGFACATLHLGWGMEDDDAARALIEAVLKASEKHRLPLYIETHRATVFQDIWRTVQFTRWYPELRFNGDFSHWYTGQELVYGGFENKFKFLEPVFERVRFLHGRIGNPGCIQVDIGDGEVDNQPFVAHFRELWTASMAGFLQSAGPGDYLIFSPELLASGIYYARLVRDAEGNVREEGDRWQQSLVLCRIARECFAQASERTS